MPEHIVLAYSGGLDTSVAVHWLAEHYDAKVTACLVDMGQAPDQLTAAQARALANGAEDCIVTPALHDFANAYVAPAIQANAMYEGAYPLGTALSRPLIAAKLVEVAHKVGADAVAHGCTGKGNDQVRIETGVAALDPSLTCLAPQRTHPMTRDAAIAYASEHGLELPPIKKEAYSTDENIWTRSVEGGDLEDPAQPVPEAAYAWTTSPVEAPDEPGVFTLEFQNGIPTKLNGKGLDLATLCAQLNDEAGAHGVGRIDHVENRLVGIKSREVYEAPAAQLILTAKKALETLVLTRDEYQTKPLMEQKFAQLTYDGLWYTPVMAATRAFLGTVQANVNGLVTVQAFKGTLTVLGRESTGSLYNAKLATYGTADAFDHEASTGFIRIWSLPAEVAAHVRGKPSTAQDASTNPAPSNTPSPSTKGEPDK